MVSGVNAEMSVVTVEWFERGETKGKEASAVGLGTTSVDDA